MVNTQKVVLVLFATAFLLALLSLVFFLMSAKSFMGTISGYATSTGEANLSVETVVAINFTTSKINWGSGRVNSGQPYATLTTEETTNVTAGNWTLQTSGGLRLQNIGNVNVTLNLSGTKTAAQMLGGTNPLYTWKFTEPEANSCLNSTGSPQTFADYDTVYTTTTSVCGRFRFIDANDTLRIDFSLQVPSDSLTGALGDTITATAFATT